MKSSLKFLLLLFLLAIIILGGILWFRMFHKPMVFAKPASQTSSYFYSDRQPPSTDYYLDSTYKLVIGSRIDVYKVSSGKKINSYEVRNYTLKSVIMHPSGKYLAIFYEDYISVYNLTKKGEEPCMREDVDAYFQRAEFSESGKYLLLYNYREPEVEVFSFPGLKSLARQYLGVDRNDFWWEEHGGKIIFFYKEYREMKSYYRTEFPANPLVHLLRFSDPVLIDSIPGKE
jgi:hypothetical protein